MLVSIEKKHVTPLIRDGHSSICLTDDIPCVYKCMYLQSEFTNVTNKEIALKKLTSFLTPYGRISGVNI